MSRNIINGEIARKTSLERALLNWKIYLKKPLRQLPKDKVEIKTRGYKLEVKRYKWENEEFKHTSDQIQKKIVRQSVELGNIPRDNR